MKVIVITGSTRGIGRGLAESFLALDCTVVVSGRTQEAVDETVAQLQLKNGAQRVFGQAADVTSLEQVENLWQAAVSRFGRVDIWVNNAGLSHGETNFWDLQPELIDSLVRTNIQGVMYGTRVALQGMLAQGFGAMYIMEGLGSDGRRTVKGMSLYGTTKAAVGYLAKSLAEDVEDTPVIIGSLRPGMVITDLILEHYQGRETEWDRFKRVLNIFGERVETVTPWLAQRILSNTKNGSCIKWLTTWRLIRNLVSASMHRRHIVEEL
jgi:NAD(P)-dependent dehydrogenase (short-subunit alcohol dehydrogenase family)